MTKERDDDEFFVLTEKHGSHKAFGFWLNKRNFTDYRSGVKDKRGHELILLSNVSDQGFSRQGIVCCVDISLEDATEIIDQHLKGHNDE